jgi:predicted metal-dependent HD superfamily phosphohydrolase
MLGAERVAEVNLGSPPQVRCESGEILFVPTEGKTALLEFVNQEDLRIEQRLSIWSSLLSPFLDTWEEQDHIDREFEWLAKAGLTRAEVDAWRREVAVAMMAYNFGARVWEWVNLDLYDALIAQRACLGGGSTEFADFYSRAMRLAAMDPVSPGNAAGGLAANLPDALSAVLTDWLARNTKAGGDSSKEWIERHAAVEQLKARLLSQLTAAYSEPHRHYHTLAHIESSLAELARVWGHAIHLNEVRWALLFHDAVYDTRRQDNEARSADWACSVMDELRRPEEEKARVRELILATAHSREPRTPDEALLLDIDTLILGAKEAAFDEYDRAIRAEYEWVPDARYRQARAEVLQSFLNRRRLYHTAHFRARYEPTARANLQRALARLSE